MKILISPAVGPGQLHGVSSAQTVVGQLDTFSPDAWVGEIEPCFARAQGHTLHSARTLYCAKERLQRGQWTQILKCKGLKSLGISKSTASMLVVIGKELGSLNVQTSGRLPRGWNTLYFLAQLGKSKIERLVAEGIVHPALTLTEAKALAECGGRKVKRRISFAKRLEKVRYLILEIIEQGSPRELAVLGAELTELAMKASSKSESHAAIINSRLQFPFWNSPLIEIPLVYEQTPANNNSS